MKIRAILFDMDGVIMDSMPLHFQAWHQAFASIGVEVKQEEIYLREGEKGEVTAREILKARKIPYDEARVQAVVQRKRETFQRIAAPRLFPGVVELLEELRGQGISLGLITGTSRKEVEKLLPDGLLGRFDVVVTGSDVQYGKPQPEPYLKGVQELQVDPSQCVVIENSPNGVRSAKGAGLYCIALTTSLPQEHLNEADWVVDSLVEVRDALHTKMSEG